jgi:glycosyltransferase involved in cell wall biosynthesis
MLSILIPTYNYNVYPLVAELLLQCKNSGAKFEIITIDDASQLFRTENNKVNTLENCSYEVLQTNIGRSKIRNLLASKARFNWLLFLDADVFPKNENFIAEYLDCISTDEKVVAGGLLYKAEKPEQKLLLRWVYGTNREVITKAKREEKPYQSFLSSNFLTTKKLIESVPFNETMPDLRREDTLFSHDLMQNNIPIQHIDNPVYHLGLDDFETAIKKENESLDGLKYLLNHDLMESDYIKISRLYATIRKLGLHWAVHSVYKLALSSMMRNLSGDNPSLSVFDFYRIGYLCGNGETKTDQNSK